MNDYDKATYGDRIAVEYDSFIQISSEQTQAAVETLAALAEGGPVLELGIGTGRIALPLAARGLEVRGIDASQKMVDELRKKPGGDAIPVTMGDFGDVAVDGRFHLIFVVFSTFFALPTQEAQVRCFANVAAHLEADGLFVMETFVPDKARLAGNQNLTVTTVGVDAVRLIASVHDPLEQQVKSQQVVISDSGTACYPVQLRYAWPSELDLMARLAGLHLKERWGTWQRSPFRASDTSHISVYQRLA